MAKLKIAYNNAYNIVMNYRRRNSASLKILNDYNNNVTIKYGIIIIHLTN